MPVPLIEFRSIYKSFNGMPVLADVNFEIFEGEVTTIIGLSGSGKSVLLKHIVGLMKPDSGAILIRGRAVGEMKKGELTEHLSHISYMFQGNALFDSLTVFENVAMPLKETTNLAPKEIYHRVMNRLEQAELTDAVRRYPGELSGGMQKRVALARALVTDPQIVLFDEPTTGQDPVRKNAILGMIAQYQKRFGFTAILVSHEIPDVYFISNRILALYGRRVVFQGSPEELDSFEHPFKEEVINSLEALQKELTGLYSQRQFRALHRFQMAPRKTAQPYALIVFTTRWLEARLPLAGYEVHQSFIRVVGSLLDRYFGAAGGFSTRRQAHEFITVLPYFSVEEGEKALKELAEELSARDWKDVFPAVGDNTRDASCRDFSLYAGVALGETAADIDQVIALAREAQKEIFLHRCYLSGDSK